MKYFIKVITGFREDQFEIIPMQEAHKAYYLFKHQDERGVFDNGVALIGKNIQEIKPSWNETMGWNLTHELTDDDWNDIKNRGVEEKMRTLIEKAKEVGDLIENNKSLMKMQLADAIKLLPEKKEAKQLSEEVKKLSDKFKV